MFSKILILLTLEDIKEGEEIDLLVAPNETKFNQHYRVEGEPQSLKIVFSGSLDSEEVKKNQNLGSVMSGLNNYGAATLETVSFVLSFFSFDPSGSLMKLS